MDSNSFLAVGLSRYSISSHLRKSQILVLPNPISAALERMAEREGQLSWLSSWRDVAFGRYAGLTHEKN